MSGQDSEVGREGRMKVAVVQHDIAWEDPEANFTRLAPMIADAAADGARLVVLTEMYSVGFSLRTEQTAEPVDGPSTRFLADQAIAQGVWVCGSLPAQPRWCDAAVQPACPRGARGGAVPLRQDPSVHVRARRRALRRGEIVHDGRRRRPTGQPLRVLRPALRRRVLGARARHRLLRGRRQLAGGSTRALDHTVAGARDREPGLRRRGESRRARVVGSITRATR